LEILLAVTILGVVVIASYNTWNAAITAWKRGTNAVDTFQRQRVVLDALAELAKSLVFFNTDSGLYEVIGEHDAATGDSVSFVTASDALLPPSESLAAGMRRVTISMQRDRSGRTFLGIANRPAVEVEDVNASDAVVHVLSADVVGFGVRYRDPQSGDWGDKWGDVMLPGAIEFTVAFAGGRGSERPVLVTRAVEFPAAEYALQTLGQPLNQLNTTNQVTRRELDLTGSQRESDTGEAE
jgi:hypothetical protein